ncbi:MAG: hypothetical protein H6719_25290 [Sandaracinaceae bacterium]|nr:hypothetical protein [Sandaracinaceae bacterium]
MDLLPRGPRPRATSRRRSATSPPGIAARVLAILVMAFAGFLYERSASRCAPSADPFSVSPLPACAPRPSPPARKLRPARPRVADPTRA